jgi:hypothetical protein
MCETLPDAIMTTIVKKKEKGTDDYGGKVYDGCRTHNELPRGDPGAV